MSAVGFRAGGRGASWSGTSAHTQCCWAGASRGTEGLGGLVPAEALGLVERGCCAGWEG